MEKLLVILAFQVVFIAHYSICLKIEGELFSTERTSEYYKKIGRPIIYDGIYTFTSTKKFENIEDKLITEVSGEGYFMNEMWGKVESFSELIKATETPELVFQGDIDYVPTNLKSYFYNLRSLIIILPRMTTVDSEGFLKYLPDLEELNILESSLFYLPGSLFQHNKKLISLLIQSNGDIYNSLQYIGRDLLTNVSSLKYVHFKNHTCIDEMAAGQKQIEKLSSTLQVVCPICRAKSCDDLYSNTAGFCHESCF